MGVQNITVEPARVSWDGDDIGLTDGDIEIAFEEQVEEVLAQQTGTNVLSEIRTGKQIEAITINIQETTGERLKKFFAASGGSFTPDEQEATEVAGWGFSKDFTQVTAQAKSLILHPVVKDAGDLSRDMRFWLAYPDLDSIMYSGETRQMLSVSFKIFPDMSKVPELRYFAFGDHTQDLDEPTED